MSIFQRIRVDNLPITAIGDRAVLAPEAIPAPKRDLIDACELIEAELDSAAASCGRQSAQAAARSRTMAEQAHNIANVATHAAEIAAEASQNVTDVAVAGEELSAAGREIAMQAARSSEIARHAVATSDEAAQAMSELGTAAVAIGEVVRSIAAIASRTNLLALNATIEAARAGAAGRGFSVVAAEVKELSRQTAAATQDISARIRTIQTATNGSVAAMQGVGSAVREMDSANAAVAAAIEEQEATLRQMAERLQGASASTAVVADTIGRIATGGAALGALSEEAYADAAATDAQVSDLRGNVLLVLRRVSTLGDSWNAQVPVQTPGRLTSASWSGEVQVLEVSEAAALVRLPQSAAQAMDGAQPDDAATLTLVQTGPLASTIKAWSNGRLLLGITTPPPSLASFVQRVHADDERFITAAKETALRISAALSRAADSGAMNARAPFDMKYQLIQGSDPAQYLTSFAEHADRLIRPILDELLSFDPAVIGTFVVDRGGYAATHNTRVSHPFRPGDPTWNARNCRNRRLFDDRAGLAAGRSTAAHLLQSYERDMGNGERQMIKEADAPIHIGGRHWGAFRLMYQNAPHVIAGSAA